MGKYKAADFTFAICAYKESPYLEECVISLLEQTIKVNMILVTSTPNEHIEAIVKKYSIPYYINSGEAGIAEDWNFGYKMADTKIVTIAHQDDIYEKHYAAAVLDKINESRHPLIAFTDYGEIRGEKRIVHNKLLHIKRFMLLPMKIRWMQNRIRVRRFILSFGSAICCPSVAYVKENLPEEVFTSKYRSNLDWQAWERLSKYKGTFIYADEVLMFHRIHNDSATTAIIKDDDRGREDYEMFCLFWPKWIARILESFYQKAEKSNDL